MEKFSQMTYERPQVDVFAGEVRDFLEKFKSAGDYAADRDLFLQLNEKLDHIETMCSIAEIRNTVNTANEYYEKEVESIAQITPQINLEMRKVYEEILESPFLQEFSNEFGENYIRSLKNQIRFANEKNVDNQVKESLLVQKYAKVSAVCTTRFHGEDVNFYGLLKYMESTDRNVRREAFKAWADLYESISRELDDIYSQLIQVRCDMAQVLGFKDYIDMIYQQRERFDYDREDVKNFRRQIKEVLVPICDRLFKEQKERLGIDVLHYYDEALVFPEGNAVPEGTSRELIEKASKMYHELSEETGEFFDFMTKYELFDLETKPGKRQGGYCTSLPEYKAPFIFSNFNGTSADVDVLTHEAGHAFESYVASRRLPLSAQVWPTMEVCEIHSMSMEFFTYPWMDLFFGKNTEKYKYAHFVSAITCIPYMACVDEFQHRVFEENAVDAAKRRKIWKELEETYMPWRDYDGNEFLENGGFWMQKQHIFMSPFYYIDYALAQMGALEFYSRMKADRKTAWEDYFRLCCAGGSKGYYDLLKTANLSDPFKDGTVKKIMDALKEDLVLK